MRICTRNWLRHAVAASLGAMIASQANAAVTSWNFDPDWPTTAPGAGFTGFTGFLVFLPGNQSAIVTGNYNSFVNPQTTITYNSKTNQTVIDFTSSSGAKIALGPTPGQYGPANNPVPHFGFTGNVPGASTGGEKLPPVAMEWIYGSSNSSVKAPVAGVNFKSNGSTGPTKYLIEYVTVTSGGVTSGDWFELPYQGSYKFNFVGSGGPVTLSNAGFLLSNTEIPLDNLNTQDYPSPGAPGSTFTAQPNLDGSLTGGVPEPSTWAMMSTGFVVLGFAAYRQKQKGSARAVA
jgi:hypothetical protein